MDGNYRFYQNQHPDFTFRPHINYPEYNTTHLTGGEAAMIKCSGKRTGFLKDIMCNPQLYLLMLPGIIFILIFSYDSIIQYFHNLIFIYALLQYAVFYACV